MAEATMEYPPRPKFYANKVTRLLFKTATANDLGSDVCYLITQIAHQEDASRYAGPVTFWNEQLMAICGFKNVRALDRARGAATKAGWLVYQHGGKGKVGKYFTLIPQKYVTYEDGAIDETQVKAELETSSVVTCDGSTNPPEKRQDNARETPDNSQRNAEQTPEKCLTFLPSPYPKPLEDTHTPCAYAKFEFVSEAIAGIEIDGEMVTYSQDWIRWEAEFIRLWNALPNISSHLQMQLDTEERRLLHARFGEPDWFWKRAHTKFPLWTQSGWRPALLWFLEPGNVNKVNSGKYTHEKDRPNDRQAKSGRVAGRSRPEIGPGQIHVPGRSDPTF
jgi:hypothetical protein